MFYIGLFLEGILWNVAVIRGIVNVKTEILLFTSFLRERNGQYVDDAGEK
jgi:hypothetical protein